jgi:transcriptional regulator with XRE-family HTH domain
MVKARFGDILSRARAEAGMSLRELSSKSGIDYTRLSRMEHGTRPAPGLPHMRRLAELLSLNLVDLLVSTGTPREAVEQLLWAERLQLAKDVENLAEYKPQGHRAGLKNEFSVEVVSREGALCIARLGSEQWTLVTFSDADRLQVRIPPEAIQVFSEDPRDILLAPYNVFRARIEKVRTVGALMNVILTVGGIEVNALVAKGGGLAHKPSPEDTVYVVVPPAALATVPQESTKGRS